MSRLVIVLYGPPASGKDTVTRALHDLDNRYVHFQRLKVGQGRRTGYRVATAKHLDTLAAQGQIIYENEVYGARYVIDRPGLAQAANAGVPVVHIGQPTGVDAIRSNWHGPILAVALQCARSVAIERLRQRDPASITLRLPVWDATPPLGSASLTIDTDEATPDNAAAVIDHAVRQTACSESTDP